MAAQVTPFQVPLTNGFIRSFGHVRMQTDFGMEFTGGFKSIKYGRKREREIVYSNNPDPVGKTLGENKYHCSAVLYYDWWMNMLLTIQSQLGSGYGDQSFTIYVGYVGTNLITYQDQILNCTFDTTESDNQAGVAALTREIDFNPTQILFGNVTDLDQPLGSPGS